MRERIVLLARESSATAILYHALAKDFDPAGTGQIVRVVYEEPPTKWRLLRSRAKRLGAGTVIGQVLFQVFVAKPLSARSSARKAEILQQAGASDVAIPNAVITRSGSVNDPATWELVRSLAPRAVVINGTRILSQHTITALGVPILNTHVGITPMYRGVHGAYWALVHDDPAHCGVTVHHVDAGVDTGYILHQAVIQPTAADNFSTYPTLQMVSGSKLMVKAVREVIDGTTIPRKPEGSDRRWEIPTLWQYLRNRSRSGVR